MNKLKVILSFTFSFLFFINSFSQSDITIKENKYQIIEDYNMYSDVIYIGETKNNGILCVKEKNKSMSSNSNYSFYHYNSNRELINRSETKIKTIDKVFLTQDSIYLIKYKKNYISNNNITSSKKSNSMSSELKNIEFSYHSASLENLTFKEHYWGSIGNNKRYQNTNTDDFKIRFKEDDTKKKLLRMFSTTYSPSKEDINLANIKIFANDSLERTNYYSVDLQVDIFNENFKTNLSKKITLTNNIGEFKIRKYRIHPKNNSVYLLLSTYDNKKKKIISFKNKINTQYHIVKISPDGVQYNTINDDIHSLATVNMELSENQVICAGMYSNTNGEKINGFFRLDFDLQTLDKKKHSYLGYSNQFLKDIKASRSKGKFETISSDYIDIEENEDCLINIEEYKFTENNVPMMGMPGGMMMGMSLSSSVTKQKSIIAAKISKDHQIIWSRYIKNKDSKSSSFTSKNINGTNCIIKENIPRTHKQFNRLDKITYLVNHLYMLSINENGEIKGQRFYPHDPDYTFINIINNSTNNNIFTYNTTRNQVFKLQSFSLDIE